MQAKEEETGNNNNLDNANDSKEEGEKRTLDNASEKTNNGDNNNLDNVNETTVADSKNQVNIGEINSNNDYKEEEKKGEEKEGEEEKKGQEKEGEEEKKGEEKGEEGEKKGEEKGEEEKKEGNKESGDQNNAKSKKNKTKKNNASSTREKDAQPKDSKGPTAQPKGPTAPQSKSDIKGEQSKEDAKAKAEADAKAKAKAEVDAKAKAEADAKIKEANAKGKEAETKAKEAETKAKEADAKMNEAEKAKLKAETTAELEKAKANANAKNLDSNSTNSSSNSSSDILNKILMASLSDNKLMNELVNSIKTQPNRNIPDKFGPNTTMAELANYFADVVLFQLMNKFDINTKMSYPEFISSLVASEEKNDTAIQGENKSNVGSSSINGNINLDANKQSLNERNSGTLMREFSINNNTDGNNSDNFISGAYGNSSSSDGYSTQNQGYPPSSPIGMGMGGPVGMGMGGPVGMGGPMGTTGATGNQPDTRSRLDIQNENADMDLQKTKLSAENKEFDESITKNEIEIEKLKNEDPEGNAQRIKELEANNAYTLNKKAKNINTLEDIARKQTANKKAENSLKGFRERAGEVGSGFVSATKSGVKAVGTAAKSGVTALGSATTSVITGAKNLVKGKDMDVLNTEHDQLSNQLGDEKAHLKELNQKLKDASTSEEGDQIKSDIQKSKNKQTNLVNKMLQNRNQYDIKESKLNAIKGNNIPSQVNTSDSDENNLTQKYMNLANKINGTDVYNKIKNGKSLTVNESNYVKKEGNFQDNDNDEEYEGFKNHVKMYHSDGHKRKLGSRIFWRGGSFRKATPNARHTKSKNNKKPKNTKKTRKLQKR